jgi:hypothetical protein
VHVNNFDYAGSWKLEQGASHSSPESANLVGSPAPTDASFTFSTNKAHLGISGDIFFRFVVTYVSFTAWRSNEAIGDGMPNSNVGQNPVTFTSYFEYPSGAEVKNTKSVSITGSAGWRMMSNPVNGATFNDLLSGIWTQGFTGSDAPGVSSSNSNVRTYNTATKQFESISNQSNTMAAGTGFIVYVFSDDNYDDPGDAGFPKTLSLSGAENSGPVSPTINTENKDPGVDNVKGWTLIGNPYATTIDSDNLTRTNVENAVYVYNTASASYYSWNGSSGDLTNGLIAPFQGFFVQTSQSGTPSLTIPLSAKKTGATFLGKQATVRNMRLLVKGEGLENSTWLQFSQGGSKSYDSFDTWKLLPLDPVYALLGTGLENALLDVNSLPYFDEVTEIPLHFSATKAGAFELSVTDFNVPAGYVVTLVDNVTGNRVQLASDVKYSFNNAVAAKAVTSIEKNRPTGASASSSPRFTLIIDPGTTTAAERGALPNTMSLDANYPNPFNPTTNIRFTLGSAANVKLAVYDATGREVEVITSGMKAAGAHTLTWNAAARASGVYLLRLEANGQTLTRKMTLLK